MYWIVWGQECKRLGVGLLATCVELTSDREQLPIQIWWGRGGATVPSPTKALFNIMYIITFFLAVITRGSRGQVLEDPGAYKPRKKLKVSRDLGKDRWGWGFGIGFGFGFAPAGNVYNPPYLYNSPKMTILNPSVNQQKKQGELYPTVIQCFAVCWLNDWYSLTI